MNPDDIYEVEERTTTDLSHVDFSDEDIDALDEIDYITRVESSKIKISHYIGTVGLPSGKLLQVSPKDTLTDFKPLYYMVKASRVNENLVTGPREIGFTTGESFIDVLANVFDEELKRLIQQGVHTEYVTYNRSESHIRGQLKLSQQIKQQEPLATSFESRYDNLTADIPLNRLLVYTASELASRVGDEKIKSRLQRRVSQLTQKVHKPSSKPDPEKISLTQETQEYKPLLKIAERILDDTYIDTFGKKTRLLQSVLINTQHLFQEVIFRAFKDALRGTKYIVHGDADPNNAADSDIGHLLKRSDGTKTRKMEPDIFVRSRGTPRLIADAKWRQANKPKQKNLYQVTAYQRKTTSHGIIFYPEQGGQIEGTYEITKATGGNTWTADLRVVEIPLTADSYEKFEAELKQTLIGAIEDLLNRL